MSALLCSTLLSLTACGGGGSSDSSTPVTPPPTTSFDTSSLQGRWETAAGASTAYTAIVVPGANNVATAWVLAQDASRLAKLSVDGEQALTGKTYPLDGSAAQAVAGTLSLVPTLTTPNAISLNTVLGATTLLNQSSNLAGMAAAADAAGNWKATAGSVVANWTLTDTGAISGTSSTGCTYAGNTMTPTTVKLYTVEFSETCAGTATSFNGIATLNTDKSRLTVAATDSTSATATALFFVKQ